MEKSILERFNNIINNKITIMRKIVTTQHPYRKLLVNKA